MTWQPIRSPKAQNSPLPRAPELGDLSIRTNSLTSRGGFATGVVTPDRDAVNRNIAEYNKKTNELLEKITKTIADIGKF